MPELTTITRSSAPADKITLFRSLFRGREDVYPRRFESRKSGKSGYAPACANEWVRGICDKRAVKCAQCPNRQLLPVTDDVIRQHLTGFDDGGTEFVMGVYPMLLDETCLLLAIDFDKENWQEDVATVAHTARDEDVPFVVERSRSGNGAHLWIFFEQAVPATMARKLGAHLLTNAMEQRPDLGFSSYDRFFPSQDTLPRGGFGNLIALPLQHTPRAAGNSIFLDEDLTPYGDQWAMLANVRKLDTVGLNRRVRAAEKAGRILGVRLAVDAEEEDTRPWTTPPSRRRREPPLTGPFPEQLEIVVADQIYIPKTELPAPLRNQLVGLAAFQNPDFYKAQAMRLSTYGKPRIIACAEDCTAHLALPRGCQEAVEDLLAACKIGYTLVDKRTVGEPLDVANMVLFLASDESIAVNGAALVVDNTTTITEGTVPRK